MQIAFSIALFFLIIIVFELTHALFRKPDTRPAYRVVERFATSLQKEEEIDILAYRKFSDIKIFDMFLGQIPAVNRLDELMQQGGVKILAGIFILFIPTIGALLFLLCASLQAPIYLSFLIACTGMVPPYLYLLYKRNQRRSQFEILFPDALDLMGYSLKAGHSILASFQMVAEEMAEPVKGEFTRLIEEINFGTDLNTSLRNFSRRIDSPELKFFVTSVIIQRETGGNLVEMLLKISGVIRKKFRFREKVKTLTAEGKLSALILLALPFFVGAAISILNPEYIMVLFSDPLGTYAIAACLIMMIFGSLMMYKLVQLDL